MEERNKVINIKSVPGENERTPFSKLSHYKPDEELIQSTARIKNQRDMILDRIQKMELAHTRVKEAVYQKVKRDYSLQLQTISELLNEKKEALKKEIKDLYIRREKLTMEINRHREILEEAEFRHFLGEFTQSQYQEVESFEAKEIEKFETDLAHIAEFVQVHENLFDPEDLGVFTPKKSAEVTKTVAQPQPAPRQTSKEKAQQTHPATASAPKSTMVDEDEVSEFEALFMDDEEQEAAAPTETPSIQNIIQEASTQKTKNYYSSKTESSVTERKQAPDGGIESDEKTPLPDKLSSETAKTEADHQAPASIDGDSINEIFDSIKDTALATDSKEIPLEDIHGQAAHDYYLQVVEGELDQKEYTLKENTSIGRASSNDVVLKAPKVSRQHAAINMYNNQFILIDLKSSNGVYVNGAKVDECVLNAGDEVSVGGYKFLFLKKQ